MKKYLLAIALTVALPAMAQAQTVSAAPKAPSCEKKDMAGCKDMAKMDHSKHDMTAGADPHTGHDMSKMDHGSSAAKAAPDPHAGHDMSKPMAKPPVATPAPRN